MPKNRRTGYPALDASICANQTGQVLFPRKSSALLASMQKEHNPVDNLTTVEGILDFAIRGEEESAQFYTDLAQQVKRPGMSQIFLEFAEEEKKHKAKLLAVKAGKQLAPAARKVADLNITDYLVDVEPGPDLDYQGALIVAMKKEKAAFMLYNQLASLAPDAALRDLLTSLAQEEARHKLRFEVEYDQVVLTEN